MPKLKLERQNKNNRVSLEYPARLLINGRVVADEFPDWYSVLEHDRYQMANGTSISAMGRPQRVNSQSPAPSGQQVETRGRENVGRDQFFLIPKWSHRVLQAPNRIIQRSQIHPCQARF